MHEFRLVEWLQQTLGPRVHNVVLSSQLHTNPAVLVQGQMGLSPTMQRYMQQQAAAQGASEQKMFGASLNQPILEINPNHPITQQLDMMVSSALWAHLFYQFFVTLVFVYLQIFAWCLLRIIYFLYEVTYVASCWVTMDHPACFACSVTFSFVEIMRGASCNDG